MNLDDTRIAIIGLGYVGLPLAIEFGKKYKVLGFDINQDRVAASADANPNPNLGRQTLRVPSQRKQGDVQINQAILAQLVQNLEIAKMSLRTETPLIQVIDSLFCH